MKKSLRALSAILSILMLISLFSVLSVTAQAAETSKSASGGEGGSTGDCYWSWSSSDNTLVISGSGRMDNYLKTTPWMMYSDQIYKIVIEEGVEYIGEYAFRGLSNVRYVYISDSVEEIGETAFYECASLSNVALGCGLKKIGAYAFLTTNLKTVSVPPSVTTLGNYCFGYNENKDKYTYVPVSGFTVKGDTGSAAEAYANKCGFTFLESDSAVSHLDLTVDTENFVLDTEKKESDYDEVYEGVFDNTGVTTEGCRKIGADTSYLYYYDEETERPEYVKFNDGEKINPEKKYYILYIIGLNEGYDWIHDVKGNIHYAEIKKEIGFSINLNGEEVNDAYMSYNYYDNSLSILVPYDNFYIREFEVAELSDGTVELTKYKGSDEEVYIPEEIDGKKVSAIGYRAFYGCHNTEYVNLPETVKKIDNQAFYDCGVNEVDLNNGLEEVGDYAFCTKPGIPSVTVPASVTTIGNCAFGSKVDDGYHPEKMDSCRIIGTKGSAAETYANENGFEFIDVDAPFMVKVTYDLNGGTLPEIAPEEYRKQVEETGKFTAELEGGGYIKLLNPKEKGSVIPPEGKDFDAVEINGNRYEFGYSYGLAGDFTIKFLYKDKELPKDSNITFNLNGASVKNDFDNDVVKKSVNSKGSYVQGMSTGHVIPLTKEELMGDIVAVPEGVELEAVEIDGKRYELGTEYKTVGNAEIKYIWNCGKIDQKCKVTYDFNGGKPKYSELSNTQEENFGTNRSFTDELPMVLDAPYGKVLDYYTVNGVKYEKDPEYYFVNEDVTVKLFWKDSVLSGDTGDCKWSFDKDTGVLTISGNGNMGDYEAYDTPWYPFKDGIKKVVIEEGVKNVGKGAFFDCTKLTSVSLPSTLETIGEGAFTNTGLTYIKVPSSVTEIGKNALGYNYNLKDGLKKVDGFTIYADEGSKAAEYAGDNGLKREDTSKTPADPEPSKGTDPSAQIKKVANTIKVTVKTKSLKASKLKKKKQTVKAVTVKKAQGKVTYKIVKKGTTSKIYKKIKISKKGVITFKKGKYAKKTYKIKLKITAAGNSKYNKKTVTKTIKVKVK